MTGKDFLNEVDRILGLKTEEDETVLSETLKELLLIKKERSKKNKQVLFAGHFKGFESAFSETTETTFADRYNNTKMREHWLLNFDKKREV